MDIKKLKLAIEQAQKVCNEMNQCANKFILQDSINDMNEALTINDVVFNESTICPNCNKYVRMQGNGMIHQLCECVDNKSIIQL